jgi:cytochrome c oxidase subunit 3
MEIPYTSHHRADTGLYNAKLGIWLFLASEVMLFGGLFSSYILLRVGAGEGTWPHGWLDVRLGALNTIFLALSAITTLLAWASLKVKEFGKFKFYHACTLLLALAFLGVKSYEYYDKFHHYEIKLANGTIADGHFRSQSADFDLAKKTGTFTIEGHIVNEHAELMDVRKHHAEHKEMELAAADIAQMENYQPRHNTFTAIYFTMSGLHALHIIGGAIVIFYLWGPGSKMWKTDPERFTNRVEVSGLFWHFVDLVWVFLFPVLYLT